MLQLDFHPLVEADLTESAVWYGRQQRGLDKRFLNEALEQFKTLPAKAHLYGIRFSDIRRA